ncbi:hypothetical protein VNO78_18127 [Psophocarpus tetragonolobus]|uniref:Uncharacterized protein n=1 Tax=Psophocarpus tetragonolobus TaxID=3891 RepID=A0AAN9SHT0_PSOTE
MTIQLASEGTSKLKLNSTRIGMVSLMNDACVDGIDDVLKILESSEVDAKDSASKKQQHVIYEFNHQVESATWPNVKKWKTGVDNVKGKIKSCDLDVLKGSYIDMDTKKDLIKGEMDGQLKGGESERGVRER